MKTLPVPFAAVALVAALSLLHLGRTSREEAPAPTRPAGTKLLSRLPVAFVPNLGQWKSEAAFVSRFGAMTVFLEKNGWTFTLVENGRAAAVGMEFAGEGEPRLVPGGSLPGVHHYFLGDDPQDWRSDVPLYAAVRYHEIRPGVDVLCREQDGHFEYDLVLQPDAELEELGIAVEGIERIHIDGDGALVLETALGPVRMPAPPSWEEGPSGEKSPIECRYVLLGGDRFGFEAPERRHGWALVVDPGLVWSTFLGGRDDDIPHALAVGAQGAVTVAGYTFSVDFPTTPGAFDTTYTGLGTDAFITRLSSDGSRLIWSTFLGGGTNGDGATDLALDAQGVVTIGGWTYSNDFPTTPGAFDTTYNGGETDTFVARLSADGSKLVWSTLLGGTDREQNNTIAVDGQGAAIVAGVTRSASFPTTLRAFDTTYNGGTAPNRGDAYVARLSSDGSRLVWSTFLGGKQHDSANDLAVDAQGVVTVGGLTASSDFPTTPGAFDTTHNGIDDVFVARLSSDGSRLVWSTFLGGTNSEGAAALALDTRGVVTVAGGTDSANFPTTPGAFDTTYNGGTAPHRGDAYVARLSSDGSRLVWSTFLGGASADGAGGVALDTQGAVTVAGGTGSAAFPTTPGAFDTTYNGGGTRLVHGDAYVARLSPSGASLVYSTFLGGANKEPSTRGLALDAQGAVTVAGRTSSADFPATPGAFGTTYNGGIGDAFVTRLDMLPTGVSTFGRSSPGCKGPLAMSVTSMPRIGNANFALTCGNAPPNVTGLLGLAARRLQTPGLVLGIEVWIAPSPPFMLLPATSDNMGASEVPLPIPNSPALASVRVYAQFFWVGPSSPRPCPPLGVSASNALDITIQR